MFNWIFITTERGLGYFPDLLSAEIEFKSIENYYFWHVDGIWPEKFPNFEEPCWFANGKVGKRIVGISVMTRSHLVLSFLSLTIITPVCWVPFNGNILTRSNVPYRIVGVVVTFLIEFLSSVCLYLYLLWSGKINLKKFSSFMQINSNNITTVYVVFVLLRIPAYAALPKSKTKANVMFFPGNKLVANDSNFSIYPFLKGCYSGVTGWNILHNHNTAG